MLESDVKDLPYLFWTSAWLVTIALILFSSWLCTWLSPGCFAGLFTWTSLLQILLGTLLFWSCALSHLPSRDVSLQNYPLVIWFGQLAPFVALRWRMPWLSWAGEEQILSSAFLMDSGKEQCTWSHESPVGSQTCPLHCSVALINQAFPLSLICKAGLLIYLDSFLLGFCWVPYSLKRIEVLLLSALSFLSLV